MSIFGVTLVLITYMIKKAEQEYILFSFLALAGDVVN